MMVEKRYFERKFMTSKEVEDVLGGADSWKNVDKTESQLRPCCLFIFGLGFGRWLACLAATYLGSRY